MAKVSAISPPMLVGNKYLTPVSLLYRLRDPKHIAAWEQFVELYTPLLFAWAKQLGHQESDCADIVQDVFMILWRKLPEFEYDAKQSFHAWLKTVFLNQYRSQLRKNAMTAQSMLAVEASATSIYWLTKKKKTTSFVRPFA